MELLFGSMIFIGLPVLITTYLGHGMTHEGIASSIIIGALPLILDSTINDVSYFYQKQLKTVYNRHILVLP